MDVQQNDSLTDQQLMQIAAAALLRYPQLSDGQLSLICRSENATFSLESAGQRYALRLHRANYHSKQDIVSELLWLDALRESGTEVPQAVSDPQGEQVQTLQTEDGDVRHVVIFHWMDGEMPTTNVDPVAFRALGEVTARLHQHSRQWQRPESFRRIVWDHQTMVGEQGHWGRWQDAPLLENHHHPLIFQALDKINHRLSAYGQSPERYGLIHADLRLTNLLHHQGQTKIIDFDDCGFGWYMHDLAAAISFFEHHPRAAEWIENWLAGYEKTAHISDEDLAILPDLLMQRRLQLSAWMGSHASTEMARGLEQQWSAETVRLCHRYLETDRWPVGQ